MKIVSTDVGDKLLYLPYKLVPAFFYVGTVAWVKNKGTVSGKIFRVFVKS